LFDLGVGLGLGLVGFDLAAGVESGLEDGIVRELE